MPTTEFLFFATEEEANDYNDTCGTWMRASPAAQAWSGGPWDEFSSWGLIRQTAPAEEWAEGVTAGVAGWWQCPFLGLPRWGDETLYRLGDNPFPLNSGEVPQPTTFYDRQYWLDTIPEGAIYVASLIPQAPIEDEDE